MATTIGALAQSGAIGDHLPETAAERRRMAEMLHRLEREAKISMITVVDLEGRGIVRGNSPEVYGDDTLMRDYSDSPKPVSSIRRLILKCARRPDDQVLRNIRAGDPCQEQPR